MEYAGRRVVDTVGGQLALPSLPQGVDEMGLLAERYQRRATDTVTLDQLADERIDVVRDRTAIEGQFIEQSKQAIGEYPRAPALS